MSDIGAIVSSAADYVEVIGGVATAVTVTAKFYKGRIERRTEIDQGRRVLGLREPNCNYRSDNKHSLYVSGEQLHPDNADALETLSAPSILGAESAGLLSLNDNVRGRCESDLVLVGSPASEGCSRLVLGYSEQSGDADSLTFENPVLDLPYHWVLDKTSIDPKSLAGRYVREKGFVRRLNWRIESRMAAKRQFIPVTNPTDYHSLLTDFLLVTRIRNYLTIGATDDGKMITIIGGSHGIGTKSISVLLNDREALTDLATRVKEYEPYQALFSVGHILHDPIHGSVAQKIKFIDAQVLPDDPLVWRSAHARIKPLWEAWAKTTQFA